MATTTITILEAKVRRQLRLLGQEGWIPPDLEAEIPSACRELALMVMNDPLLKHDLIKSYSSTFSANEVLNIGAATFADLLRESLPKARLLVTGYSYPFSYFKNRLDLERGSVVAHAPRFCVEGDSLQARASTAVPTATACTLIATFVPVVAASAVSTTLPDTLLPQLTEVLVKRFSPTPEVPVSG